MNAPTCLYCLRRLPQNDVVESFPFGSRVAYDPAKQRLWIVCRRCRRWSITPVHDDDRAAAIERFERWWRDKAAHYSTDGIGLAEVNERFSVVRIGEATWNEFAAWRYASTLKRRWLKYQGSGVVTAVVLGGFVGSSVVSLPTALSVFGALWLADHLRFARRMSKATMCRVPSETGRSDLREKHVMSMELVRERDSWALNTKHDHGVTTLDEGEAVRVLSYALPRVNQMGASTRTISNAMSLIQEAGGPEGLAHRAAEPVEKGSRSFSNTALLLKQPDLKLIALEIATQEQNERRLLENELAMLRAEWQEAEEIAATVDLLEWPGGRT